MNAPTRSLDDWLAHLETLSPNEIELGLERVRAVLERLGDAYSGTVLHVAGTNGKGSSVAMLSALLGQGGYRVGTYTSPHVIRYNERVCIGGIPVGDDPLIDAFEQVDAARRDTPLTYFEFGTLAAVVLFERAAVDVGVLEVGMGGRLDAVNAIEPAAGLITNVSLDHCDWLGNDVETIAFEKAGIMRPGKPVVFGSRDVPAAICTHAEDIGARLILPGRDYDWTIGDDGWSWQGATIELDDLQRPGLPGEFQCGNAAAVLALLEAAGLNGPLDKARVDAALADLSLPGRMQRLDLEHEWLLDVAHNPAAAAMLAATLAEERRAGRTIALVGLLDDKDIVGVIEPLLDVVDEWIAVPAASGRAIRPDEIVRHLAERTGSPCHTVPTIDAGIVAARRIADPGDRILVTGSFYVVGPVLEAHSIELGI